MGFRAGVNPSVVHTVEKKTTGTVVLLYFNFEMLIANFGICIDILNLPFTIHNLLFTIHSSLYSAIGVSCYCHCQLLLV